MDKAELANKNKKLQPLALCQQDLEVLRSKLDLGTAQALAKIRAQFPDASIIMFTIYDGDEEIYRGLRAGGKAYLLKSTSCNEILSVIPQVCAGHKYIPQPIGGKLAERMSNQHLSEREREVLCLMAAGKINKDIAAGLASLRGQSSLISARF